MTVPLGARSVETRRGDPDFPWAGLRGVSESMRCGPNPDGAGRFGAIVGSGMRPVTNLRGRIGFVTGWMLARPAAAARALAFAWSVGPRGGVWRVQWLRDFWSAPRRSRGGVTQTSRKPGRSGRTSSNRSGCAPKVPFFGGHADRFLENPARRRSFSRNVSPGAHGLENPAPRSGSSRNPARQRPAEGPRPLRCRR